MSTEVQLIDDLLDLTRITHGKMRVDKQPVDLHQIVRDVLGAMRADAEKAQLSLSLELLASHPWVNGDPFRLRQVFENLLRNALKFTPAGGQIEVRSWNREEQLLIEVSDSGKGFDTEALRRLFEPFEQALQESNTASAKGLGLGLPICRGILEQHEATISASSPGPGRGARFVVDIGTIEPPTLRPAPPSKPPPRPSKAVRLLLVEDHEDTAELFAGLLRRSGYSVHVANSVQSALAVDASAFDLLLSDVGLGDESGLDLMRTLRRTRDVRGIALERIRHRGRRASQQGSRLCAASHQAGRLRRAAAGHRQVRHRLTARPFRQHSFAREFAHRVSEPLRAGRPRVLRPRRPSRATCTCLLRGGRGLKKCLQLASLLERQQLAVFLGKRHGDHSVVLQLLFRSGLPVANPQQRDRFARYHDAWPRCLVVKHERIQRIAVLGEGAGNEAPIMRVVQARAAFVGTRRSAWQRRSEL